MGINDLYDKVRNVSYQMGLKDGKRMAKNRAIEVLTSVLEKWIHSSDVDCIIAEFEEKLMKK